MSVCKRSPIFYMKLQLRAGRDVCAGQFVTVRSTTRLLFVPQKNITYQITLEIYDVEFFACKIGQCDSHGLIKFILVVFFSFFEVLRTPMNFHSECSCWSQLATSSLVDISGICCIQSLSNECKHYMLGYRRNKERKK